MSCGNIASGSRALLALLEEKTCKVPPPALATPLTNAQMDKTGATGGQVRIVLSGTEVTDGGIRPGMRVTTAGFSTAANNGVWKVYLVTDSVIIAFDRNNVASDEAADPAQTVQATPEYIRATDRAIDGVRELLSSTEVRASGQVLDARHGFTSVQGSASFELALQSYANLLLGGLGGDYISPNLSGLGTVTVTWAGAGNDTATLVCTSSTWAAEGVRDGDVIVTTGFASAANNRNWRVISRSGTTATVFVDPIITADPVTGEAGGTPVYSGFRIDLSNANQRFYSVEKRLEDIGRYQMFRGVTVNDLSLSISADSQVTGSVSLLGLEDTAMDASSDFALAPVNTESTQFLAPFTGLMFEGGDRIAAVSSADINLTNNRTTTGVLGSKFAATVFEGTKEVTGTLNAFVEGETLFNKFYNETATSLYFDFREPSLTGLAPEVDNNYGFFSIALPNVKFTSGAHELPQQEGVSMEMGFQALESDQPDPGGATIQTSMWVQVSRV